MDEKKRKISDWRTNPDITEEERAKIYGSSPPVRGDVSRVEDDLENKAGKGLVLILALAGACAVISIVLLIAGQIKP